jgi:hypothetical protein
MKNAKIKKTTVNVSQKGLLTLVASKLKGVVLFPGKLEKAKEYLDKTKVKAAR